MLWYVRREIIVILIPLVLFLASILAEYVLKLQPCNMCLVVRYHYIVLFVLMVTRFKMFALMACLLGFMASVYHKLLQAGIMSKCPRLFDSNNFEDFARSLQDTVPCSVSTSIFGVDLVWFNIVFFVFYGLYIIKWKNNICCE